MQPFSCILLAGGFSSRMGSDKALLPMAVNQEHDLLQHMLQIAQLSGAQQVVVSRDPSLQLANQTGFEFVADHYPKLGPLAGLHACLPVCEHERVLVLPVDMPALSLPLLKSLTQHTTSAYFEGYEMPCLLYRSAALNAFLTEQLTDPNARRSIRSVLNWLDADAVTLPSGEDEIALLNTNTPAEWQSFMQAFRAETFDQSTDEE